MWDCGVTRDRVSHTMQTMSFREVTSKQLDSSSSIRVHHDEVCMRFDGL